MGAMPNYMTSQEVFAIVTEEDGEHRMSATVSFQGHNATPRFGVSVSAPYALANTPVDACKKTAKRLRALADELDKATWPE